MIIGDAGPSGEGEREWLGGTAWAAPEGPRRKRCQGEGYEWTASGAVEIIGGQGTPSVQVKCVEPGVGKVRARRGSCSSVAGRIEIEFKCKPSVAPAECTKDSECEDNNSCTINQCTPEGQCQFPEMQCPAGERCQNGSCKPLLPGVCFNDFDCGVGTCHEVSAGECEECTTRTLCESGLCVATGRSPQCRPCSCPKPVGECPKDFICSSRGTEFICVNVPRTCGAGEVKISGDNCGTPECVGLCEGCRPVVCGDTLIDSPEECDDGNTASGDGCSAECKQEQAPPPGVCQTDADCMD